MSERVVIAPPPILYVGALGVALLLEAVHSLRVEVPLPLRAVGVALVVLGIGLIRRSFAALDRAGTTSSPFGAPSALVTGGAFRYSRNPVYVGMTLVYLGLAALLGSVWPFILSIPLLFVMDLGVVRREEAALAGKFGSEYQAYRRRVRRWI